ncbi:MAG: orotidine-5'-phosphate decarboxylase [Armatimonadetes bacterium]|nr:orotidine-5'-phosphate decarboxylase [Candidatus Hippobium faecium]
MKNKIIIPLDVDTEEKAVELVSSLKDHVGAFKVGLELINTAGFGIFDAIKKAGAEKIFYDCKFCDIPNTVKGASLGAVSKGVWMFNVHALGGYDMMKSAKDAALSKAQELNIPAPLVIAVTILTSINNDTLRSIGVEKDVKQEVASLAKLAKDAGLDGVVCSPHEIEIIREACGKDFTIVTPGVRPKGSAIGDQKRVMTPLEAVTKGADYIVVGRPITKAENPVEAAKNLFSE